MWKTETASKYIIRFKLKIQKAKKRTFDFAAEYNTNKSSTSLHLGCIWDFREFSLN